MTTQIRSVLEIPLFHKIYDLYGLLYSFQAQIPKNQRYTLWQKCETAALELLDALIDTSHRKGEARLEKLYIMSNRLDLLKVLIRLAKDNKVIDPAKYLKIESFLQEIGRMVGGWIKSVPH